MFPQSPVASDLLSCSPGMERAAPGSPCIPGCRQRDPPSRVVGRETPGQGRGQRGFTGKEHQTWRLAPYQGKEPGKGQGAGRQEGYTGDSPLLAVAMCPHSSRPCAKLQRHGQEAILRGHCRCSRAPELGKERAGLGRDRQSRGGHLLPPSGCQSQPSTTDTTATHGCDSGTVPAQTCRGGVCLQLRGVRQPGFGQQRAACQGLHPALPQGVMGTGRAGAAAGRAAPLPRSTMSLRHDPASPGSCSAGSQG